MSPLTPSTIETPGGRMFDLLLPDPAVIALDDIAHALAHICRFTGHTSRFYSVAEHCVLASELAEDRWGGRCGELALLHDAAETYIGDIHTILKRILGDAVRNLERRIQAAVWRSARLEPPNPDECQKIKLVDTILLATEAARLLPSGGSWWNIPADPDWNIDITGWMPLEACERFHERADELGIGLMGDE